MFTIFTEILPRVKSTAVWLLVVLVLAAVYSCANEIGIQDQEEYYDDLKIEDRFTSFFYSSCMRQLDEGPSCLSWVYPDADYDTSSFEAACYSPYTWQPGKFCKYDLGAQDDYDYFLEGYCAMARDGYIFLRFFYLFTIDSTVLYSSYSTAEDWCVEGNGGKWVDWFHHNIMKN